MCSVLVAPGALAVRVRLASGIELELSGKLNCGELAVRLMLPAGKAETIFCVSVFCGEFAVSVRAALGTPQVACSVAVALGAFAVRVSESGPIWLEMF